MSTATAERFSCDQCQRVYAWKEQLAGKRVKCKCGHPIAVPAAMAKALADPDGVGLEEDGLYALAAEAEAAAKRQPVVIIDPAPMVAPTKSRRGATPTPPAAKSVGSRSTANSAPAKAAANRVPGIAAIPYQRGPTARERERASLDVTVDMQRDVYVPLSILAVGMLLQIGYYTLHYNMGAVGMTMVGFGLSVMMLVKAVGLILFALVVATPLGVSFGGVWSAALKLAATAVFCDGITTLVNLLLSRIGGGFAAGSLVSFGILAWPVSILTYYCSFVYLFSMDTGDAWLVVVILSVVDYLFRWFMALLLLGAVMSMAHVALPAAGVPRFGSSARHSAAPDPLADKMGRLKGTNWLVEGHDYLKYEIYTTDVVNNLYAHGCQHVWFEVTRDINQHASSAGDIIAELPDNAAQRAQCYADVKAFYNSNKQITYDPKDLVDTGSDYLEIDMQ